MSGRRRRKPGEHAGRTSAIGSDRAAQWYANPPQRTPGQAHNEYNGDPIEQREAEPAQDME